jgi:hypothetical protein
MCNQVKNLVNILVDKKIEFQVISNLGKELRKKWEDSFANHISEIDKKSISFYDVLDEKGNIYTYGFMWHIIGKLKEVNINWWNDEQNCDYHFNKQIKEVCYLFYNHEDDVIIVNDASNITTDDLKYQNDLYVVDYNFTWSYIITHEKEYIGNFFIKK